MNGKGRARGEAYSVVVPFIHYTIQMVWRDFVVQVNVFPNHIICICFEE